MVKLKKRIRQGIVLLVIISLLGGMGLVSGVPVAEAAGEVIEFNDILVPAERVTGSRPPSYPGDNNWHASTMNIQLPEFTINQIGYNQVTGMFNMSYANDYLPTLWEAHREQLQPLEAWYMKQGYRTGYVASMDLFFADGTTQNIGDFKTSTSYNQYGDLDLGSYKNHTAMAVHIPARTKVPLSYSDYPFPEYFNWAEAPDYPTLSLYTGKKPVSVSLNFWFSEVYERGDNAEGWMDKSYHEYTVASTRQFTFSTNKKPNLTLTSQPGQKAINEKGLSTFHVTGYVQDPDNDTVDVIAEIPNVFYKKVTLSGTASSRDFSIPIDVLQENIAPGQYTINVKVVDPYNFKSEASTSFEVTHRLKNKAFLLVNQTADSAEHYGDYEHDPAYAFRFKYDHDPYFFDNPMGMISDSSLWRNAKYSTFPYSGVYVASFQAKDSPKADDRFDPFRLWSRDNLSSMTFHVHRKPVALFTAKLAGGSLQLSDSSYDLDHTSASNKGLMAWQWQHKRSSSEVWNDGQPPAQLSGAYDIRLRVRDVDGVNGAGVWSDWCQRSVGSGGNLPPVAMFTVDPNNVSYRKATTVTDRSFDPDNDPLDTYEWNVVKNGGQQVWAHYGGATVPPNIAGFGVGDYRLTLKVRDNRGLWSEPYSQSVQVKNNPPAAAFYMPPEVYRDTVITLDNLTPDPDEDGDALTYQWNGRLNNSPYYFAGNSRYQAMTIRDLIARSGISQQNAISDGWEMRLTASDGSLQSNATRMFTVKNHVPTAAISGPEIAFQDDTKWYTSADEDGDLSDIASLQYFWKVTDSDGRTKLYRTPSIDLTFPQTGIYTLEHWAIDQIGAKSNIASLKVKVAENQPPGLTLTSPAGTKANPTVLDAETQGDPLIQWTYADPENDPQEKYRLEFFTKDSLLAKSIENNDSSGGIRQYQVPNGTFARFEYFIVNGRAFSKGSWSEISNEKSFIIDNPPQPGFTLLTDTGKNAVKVPIYRTDTLTIQSTATDPDEPKGDVISYQYYLKPADGTESLTSTKSTFTKKFSTNGSFTYRQVVTDSLGLRRELSQTLTVVNRLPTVNITYPTSINPDKPTIASTLTPIIKWEYQDEDGDLQQRFRVRIINLATGSVKVQSGEQASGAKQWKIPAGTLIENEKYAVELEAFDGFEWSRTAPHKYFMVNLLSIKGAVRHTPEWDANRKAYNLKKSGNEESPRAFNVYWAGERFVLQGTATGLPDTVQVTMTGGYTTQLIAADEEKTRWMGELYDPAFDKLPDGPVTFTFTATNEYQTKVDTVAVVIDGDWADYFRVHRIK
ncbi:hypothetical protein [Paenibacillus donghaensis]|uniref:PKD domain-containing protein n=1 Tax=Paenibacillus donghaensis TaxID=414771 RepID=A0A2Z2KID3_9BACL|nr:hypothetical protein [Paenibacillus donghaensis]ASA19571.1 hypothetical protein B9T62_01280 [Paenibacillus donghaensis]